MRPPTPMAARTAPERHVLRAIGLFALSPAAGAALIITGTQITGLTPDKPKAALAGAVLGAMLSPLLVFALWPGPWMRGFVAILALSCAAQAAVAEFTPGDLAVLSTMPAAIVIYPAACLSVGAWLRLRADDRRSAQDLCPSCGYDMSGLPGPICPECGAGAANPQRRPAQ